MATKKQNYSESDISVFSGLKGIRAKPSMYLGDMNEATWTCVREAADNCSDEFLAGRNDSCLIIYDDEGYAWIVDKGLGIPVKEISIDTENGGKAKISALTAVVSKIHAGGKFTDSAYKVSSGTHGVGITAVNAVSSEFDVWTCRDSKWYHTAFEKGVQTSDVAPVKKPPALPLVKYKAKEGTIVRFKLDKTVFPKGASFNPDDAHNWAAINSHLNAGFTIMVVSSKGKAKYYEPDGLDALIRKDYDAVRSDDTSYDDVYRLFPEGSALASDHIEGHPYIALDFCVAFPENVVGTHFKFYTNGVSNPDGGKHEEAMWSALTKAISHFTPARSSFSIADLRDGIVGVLNVKINSPQFNNQTKEKLVDTRVKIPVEQVMFDYFTAFFKGNKEFTKTLIERASALSKMRDTQALQRKTLLTIKKATANKPAKYAGTTGKVPAHQVEIFLVEGDSAGGTARNARYRDFQAVLPLKGKPMNAMKAEDSKVITSQEVMNIFSSIGYIPDGKSKPNTFGRLILLSDADVDGYHINALLLTLIQKYVPELIEEGKVFAVDTTNCKLYGRDKNGHYFFGATSEEVHKEATKAKSKIVGETSYLKGWGELNPAGLRIAAFNPETRRLIKITPIMGKELAEFVQLMGEDVAYRKDLMSNSVK